MSYFVTSRRAASGLGLSIDGSFRLGAALAPPVAPFCPGVVPPGVITTPLSPPAPVSGLGLSLSLPSADINTTALVDQIVGGFSAAMNTEVDAAVDRAMARLPTTPQYLSMRNGLLGLLALQAVVVLAGMYFIEKDFGRA